MSQYKELPQVEFAVAAQNAFQEILQFNGRSVVLSIGGAFLPFSSLLLLYH